MQEPEVENTCRFCHYPSSPTNTLFHPCKCTGTIRHIHGTCLEKWLRKIKKDECELCHFKYQFNYVYEKKMSLFKLLLRLYTKTVAVILRNMRMYMILFVPSLLALSFGYVGCLFFSVQKTFVTIATGTAIVFAGVLVLVEVLSLAQGCIKNKAEREVNRKYSAMNENEKEMMEEALKRFGEKAAAEKKRLALELGIVTEDTNQATENTTNSGEQMSMHKSTNSREELSQHVQNSKITQETQNKVSNGQIHSGQNEYLNRSVSDFGNSTRSYETSSSYSIDYSESRQITIDSMSETVHRSRVTNEETIHSLNSNPQSSTNSTLSSLNSPVGIDIVLPSYTEPRLLEYKYPSFLNFDASKFSAFVEQTAYELFDIMSLATILQIVDITKKFIKIAVIFHIISVFGIYIPLTFGMYLCKKIAYSCKFSYFLHELNIHNIYEAIGVILLGYFSYYFIFLLARTCIKRQKIRSALNDYLGTVNIITSFFLAGAVLPLLTGTLINMWVYESFNCRYLHELAYTKVGYCRDFYNKMILPFLATNTNVFAAAKTLYEKDYKKGYLIYTEKHSINYIAFFLRTLNNYAIDVTLLNIFLGLVLIMVGIAIKDIVKAAFRNGFFYSSTLQEEKEEGMVESMFTNPSIRYLKKMFLCGLLYLLVNYIGFIVFCHLLDNHPIIFTFNSPTKFTITFCLFAVIKGYSKGLQRFYIFMLRLANRILGMATNMSNAMLGTKIRNADKKFIKWKPNKNVVYSEKEIKQFYDMPFTDKQYEQYFNIQNTDRKFMLFFIPKYHNIYKFLHLIVSATVIYLCTVFLRETMFAVGYFLRKLHILFVNYFTLIGHKKTLDSYFLKSFVNLKHLEIFVVFSLIPINWCFELIYNIAHCYKNRNTQALIFHINQSITVFISHISAFVIWPIFFFLSLKITFDDIFNFLSISKPTMCRNAFILCLIYSLIARTILKAYNVLPDPVDTRTVNHHRRVVIEFTKKLFLYTMLPYLASEVVKKYMGETMTKLVYIVFLVLPCYVVLPRSVYGSLITWGREFYSDVYNGVFLVERLIVNQDE